MKANNGENKIFQGFKHSKYHAQCFFSFKLKKSEKKPKLFFFENGSFEKIECHI